MKKVAKMDMQTVPVEKLNPAAYNPRVDLQPDDPEYQKLKRSILTHGYIDPIIWNERTGNVVGGHQRLKILVEEGYTEVEVSKINVSEKQEKVINISLNKIGGDWERVKLSELLQELVQDADVDVLLTGFEHDEIDDLLHSLDDVDIDSFFADQPEQGESEPEDEWITCPHCGEKFRKSEQL